MKGVGESLPLKVCTYCGDEKPATREHFHRSKFGKNGLHSYCKMCIKALDHSRNTGTPKPPRRYEYMHPAAKYCPGCEKEKPLTAEFWHKGNGQGGFKSRCKICRVLEVTGYVADNFEKVAAYKKAYREAHAEEVVEYQKTYYQENLEAIKEQHQRYWEANRESLLERKRKYYLENREEILEKNKLWAKVNLERVRQRYREYYKENSLQLVLYAAQYYRENQEAIKARARAYYAENADRYAAYEHARRARELGAPGEFTREEWLEKLRLYGRLCAWCGEYITGVIHRDHVIPLSKGGSNYIENIVPSCATCNLRKSAKMPEEFLALLELEGRVTPSLAPTA